MSKLKDESITIFEAMQYIQNKKYIMPAFQRQYVWSMEKIEKLWDSILQGYPISTFLFWHVDESNVTADTYFCEFMEGIIFDSAKKADAVNYNLSPIRFSTTDTAILDGQQRLTSLFISLLGETGIRPKYSKKKSQITIKTKLLIELNENKIDNQDEFDIKKYDIKFSDKIGKIEPTKFEIKNILRDEFKSVETRETAIKHAIEFVPKDSQEYAKNILSLLCEKIYEEKLIRYTEIFEMNQDDALEMFVRFNSGGVQLKKSEITMSILEAYWPSAKIFFGNLLSEDYDGFDTDFIIRTAHMIYGDVVKSNISRQVANDLKNNWIAFNKAFKNTANLLKEAKINLSRFKNSWNVLVPIIFCVYYNPYYSNFIEGILAYLFRAIFFTYFSSGTTGKLQIMKKYIISFDYEITVDMLNDINELRVNEAKLEELMNYEKGSRIAGELLYYLNLDWIKESVKYEQDHLHPSNRFLQAPPIGISIEQWLNWKKLANRIPNLQLLDENSNIKKSDKPLQEFLDDMTSDIQNEYRKTACLPNISFDILDFEKFYNTRKELLITKIKTLLK